MFNRTSLCYLYLLLLGVATLDAQPESAWDAMIREKPALLSEASPLEREILQAMTPEQVEAYLAGTPLTEIILSTGETVEALLDLKSSSSIDVSWYSVDGGGGMMSTGGPFAIGGTIGQLDAGLMTGADFELRGGFWSVVETDVLVVIPEIHVGVGETVEVPIRFSSSDFDIAAATFSIDFDETCLDFDGNPDSVSFSLPLDFTATATYDVGDLDGELDFTIVDTATPLATLPDGNVATITLTTTCQPAGTAVVAAVGFSDVPPPTFGDVLGRDVPGRGVGGSVNIQPGTRGDCNADDAVTAGDLSACVLEVFDDDGDCWLDVAGGTFPGSPIGCDANADEVINAGDLSCKILLIFGGPGACTGSARLQEGWGKPILFMDQTPKKKLELNSGHTVPVYFRPRGWEINSLVFSIDYDQRAYRFDPSDKDRDGIPDAIRFDLPASAQVTVRFDPTDADGEIDVSIVDPSQTIDRDPSEPLLTIALNPRVLTESSAAGVRFSRDPAASFGDLSGRSVEGGAYDTPHK